MMKAILQPVIDGQLGLESLGISDYVICKREAVYPSGWTLTTRVFVTAALQHELQAKLEGYVSGQTTPGAMESDADDIYLQLEEQTNSTMGTTSRDDSKGKDTLQRCNSRA